MPFQVKRKSFTLYDLEGQYCTRHCIGCSVSSLATVWLSHLHLFVSYIPQEVIKKL